LRPGEVVVVESVGDCDILIRRFRRVDDPLRFLIGKEPYPRHIPVEELEEKAEERRCLPQLYELDQVDVMEAIKISEEFDISPHDAVHVATMRKAGTTPILSADMGFDEVDGIKHRP